MSGKIIVAMFVLLAAVYGANLVVTAQTLEPLKEDLKAHKEASRLADLEIIKIERDCPECSDLSDVIGFLENNADADLEYSHFSSQKSSDLISKYGITKLPALVITGETDKENIAGVWIPIGGSMRDDAVIIEGKPPYYDMNENRVRGLVDVTYITDASCTECYDVYTHRDILSSFGITPREETTYDISTQEGSDYINLHSLTKVPTIVLSAEAYEYASLNGIWLQVGTVESDGSLVFRTPEVMNVVYKDLSNNTIMGA